MINRLKIKLLLIIFFLLNVSSYSNAAPYPRPYRFEEILMPQSNDSPKVKFLMQNYKENLRNIFKSVRNEYIPQELEFQKKDGLGYLREKKNFFYLKMILNSGKILNVVRTDFNKRAATVISIYISNLLQIVMEEREIFQDPVVKGVAIKIGWIVEGSPVYSNTEGQTESLMAFIDKDVGRKYLTFKLPIQEMIDKSRLIGFQGGSVLGKIDLNLSTASLEDCAPGNN